MKIQQKLLEANAVRKSLGVTAGELLLLFILSITMALSEGFGVALLLPVLQYVEQGISIVQGENVSLLWRSFLFLFGKFGIPINLISLLVSCFIPILVRQVFFYAYYAYSAILQQKVLANLRVEAFGHITGADLSFFEEKGHGHLSSILTLEATRVGDMVFQVFQFASIAVMMLFYVLFLLYLSPLLTAIALLTFVVIELIIRRQVAVAQKCGALVSRDNDALMSFIGERLSAFRLIKLSSTKIFESEKMSQYSKSLAQNLVNIQKKVAIVQALIEPTLVLGTFVILYVAVVGFGMKLAGLSIFLFVLMRILPLTKQVNGYRQNILSSLPSYDNLMKTVEGAKQRRDIPSGKRIFKGLREQIEFRDVSFGYSADKNIIHDVSFVIPAKKTTAIIGPSGVGKSTIVDLLVRLRGHGAGEVFFDGVPAHEFDVASLRAHMGFVSQDTFLFNDTVMSNIAYGLVDVNPEQVVESGRMSCANVFINKMPIGYNTVLGDRGGRLSGGERQRICLARALLRNPDILILDEPTSALDSESERAIQETIATVRETKTIIIIAHRFSTIREADQILVIDEGRIKEVGDHEHLVANGGLYNKLYQLQSTL